MTNRDHWTATFERLADEINARAENPEPERAGPLPPEPGETWDEAVDRLVADFEIQGLFSDAVDEFDDE